MKKQRMKGLFAKFLVGACALTLLAGCGASESASYKNADAAYSNYTSATKAGGSSGADYASNELWDESAGNSYAETPTSPNGNDYSQTSASKRKLIKNVRMNVETQEYEVLMRNVESRVKEVGGYVQNLESFNGSNTGNRYGRDGVYYGYSRYANLVLRVPQAKLDEFVNSVAELGNVVSRNESVEDVTLQYVDVKSHKESLMVEQERLLALLEKAEVLEDIITLENRLTSVRYQIESMESTLRTYDDLVDYSTVTLRIDEVEVYTPVEQKKETNWERMVNGFLQSLEDIGDGAVNFGIWFVVHLPYLVIWAIVITVVVVIFKKSRKKAKEKKLEAKNANALPKTEENKPEEKKF